MIVRSTNLRVKQSFRHSVICPNPTVFAFSISTIKTDSLLSDQSTPTSRSSWTRGFRTRQRTPFFDSSHKYKPSLNKTHACEQLLGYQFREPLLLWEALQVGYATESLPQMPRYVEGNKRLAIVGDRVLELLVAIKWYPTWGNRGEHGVKGLRDGRTDAVPQVLTIN